MQVDTQPFPVNIIEVASKKVLVRSKVADKGKNIVIGDPRTSNISQEGIIRIALDKKTSKSGGTRGRRNRAAEQSFQTQASWTVRHLRGQSGAQADGPTDSARQSTHNQRHRPPHKAKRGTQGQSTHNAQGWLVKANPTFDQSLSKYASKKVIQRDRPTKKPGHPLKQNDRIKVPERRHSKHHLFML
jgi:hypothetical protein